MSICHDKTERKAIFELAKTLKHFDSLQGLLMHPGDAYTARLAENLIRSVIENNGYTAIYIPGRGTRLHKFD